MLGTKTTPILDAVLAKLEAHAYYLAQYTEEMFQRSSPLEEAVMRWLRELAFCVELGELLQIVTLTEGEKQQVQQKATELKSFFSQKHVEADSYMNTHFQMFAAMLSKLEKVWPGPIWGQNFTIQIWNRLKY